MKKLRVSLVCALGIIVGSTLASPTFASQTPATALLPMECSLLLLSPDYARLVAQLTEQARQSGRVLKISSCDVFTLDDTTFVYLSLLNSVSAELPPVWLSYGSLVGMISYSNSSLPEPVLESVYFKPAGDIPGGSTVGNKR